MGNKRNSRLRRKRRTRAKAVPSASNFEIHSASVKPQNTSSTDVPSTFPSFSVPALINFSFGRSLFETASQNMEVYGNQEVSTTFTKPIQNPSPTVKLTEKKSINRQSFNSMDTDDVIYLYTVEPKKAKLIEVVDLSDENKDTTEISKYRNLILSTRSPESDKHSECMFELPEIVFTSPGVPKKDPPVTTKVTDAKIGSSVEPIVEKKRKRCEVDIAHCSICYMDYDSVSKGNFIFSSKCGHLFCAVCLKNLDPYKCIQCNESIRNLCKIYL